MRNRDYFNRKLERIQNKTREINHMVSTNQNPRNIKKSLNDIDDIVEDLRTQIEREPLSGNELNRLK
tara:strand:+ start:2071 stop:2271 length:201 start_codon:yes stop_codon:yes gene_type:complete